MRMECSMKLKVIAGDLDSLRISPPSNEDIWFIVPLFGTGSVINRKGTRPCKPKHDTHYRTLLWFGPSPTSLYELQEIVTCMSINLLYIVLTLPKRFGRYSHEAALPRIMNPTSSFGLHDFASFRSVRLSCITPV